MKHWITFLLLFSASLLMRAAELPTVPPASKSVVDYITVISADSDQWSVRHFEELNRRLRLFIVQECSIGSRCLVVPDTAGYAVVWICPEKDEQVSETQKKKAQAIIDSFLYGPDYTRIKNKLQAENRPNQTPEPTAPSGRGSP